MLQRILIRFFFSGLAAAGLLLSGVSRRSVVIHGLAIGDKWNPNLLITLVCAIAICLMVINGYIKYK